MARRELRLYELICLPLNVNFMLDFNAPHMTKNHVIEAFKMVKRKHPYFRMAIENDEQGKPTFVEKKIDDQQILIEFLLVDARMRIKSWQTRLVSVGCKPHDNSQSVFHLELISFDNTSHHQLIASVNHSGIDGPGLIQAIRDFIYYLDMVLDGTANVDVQSRPFLDIHKHYEHNFNLDDLKKEPIVQKYIEPVKPISESDETPFADSKFFQFDEPTTKALIDACKKHGTTVQSALSTAVMIAMINYRTSSNLTDPVQFVNSCPCNMRDTLGGDLTQEDMVCGSAALIWSHEPKPDDKLWDLVKFTGQQIKNCLNSNYGFKWWIKLVNSLPLQSYTIMSSSMGVVSIDETKLKHVKLNDLRFMGSATQVAPKTAGIMTHAFTFLNRFTFNFSYTYPALSPDWAQTFADNIAEVLKLLAANDKAENLNLAQLIGQLKKHN